jgi:hypothetical protein
MIYYVNNNFRDTLMLLRFCLISGVTPRIAISLDAAVYTGLRRLDIPR